MKTIDFYSPVWQRVIDGGIAGLSFSLSYLLTKDGSVSHAGRVQLSLGVPMFMLGRVAVNEALNCYRMMWKYIGLRDAMSLARNYAAFSSVLLVVSYATPVPVLRFRPAFIVMEFFLSLTLCSSARIARRLQYERTSNRLASRANPLAVLLVGAGRAGLATANQLRSQPGVHPVGYLDDDPKKFGQVVAGLKVVGTLASLDEQIELHKIQQVILCIARPKREMLRHVWATCELRGVGVKMVPALEDVLNGRAGIVQFRAVEMNDLLGREPVTSAAEEIASSYRNKRILITGAGGSIGSELALQISEFAPSHLLLLDKDENGLNDVWLRLGELERARATAVVADLRFPDRLRGIFTKFRPEVVFHAAAHKHVHLMETNPCEAITNNVSGTRNLVEQSVLSRVERFVQVSTDKAVNPTSVMGASKRLCEMIVQAQAGKSDTLFCCVRFGNVLGSRGSVIPIFQEQIQRGGPVTLTHPDAQRFLMTIPEAVCLLIQAGTLANNRDIFVLDMGQPVSIHKLARDLIELSGLSPERDVRIEITGLKPGEKISEVLFDEASELRLTRLDKIQAISTPDFDPATFTNLVRALERAAAEDESEEVYRLLTALNIGYTCHAPIRPWPSPRSRVPQVTGTVGNTLATELS